MKKKKKLKNKKMMLLLGIALSLFSTTACSKENFADVKVKNQEERFEQMREEYDNLKMIYVQYKSQDELKK